MENIKEYILSVLHDLNISYESLSHAPIMTVAEGTEIAKSLGVISCKNLFLVNKQKEYFLYLLPGNKRNLPPLRMALEILCALGERLRMCKITGRTDKQLSFIICIP